MDKSIKPVNMKLQEGTYDIQEGYRAVLIPGENKIRIQKRVDRHIKPGDYRCKDCKFRGKGKQMKCKSYLFGLDDVCLKRVKTVIGYDTFYFGAPYNKKPCEMFELKEGLCDDQRGDL